MKPIAVLDGRFPACSFRFRWSASDRTGALIIADDVGNTVWRVSYTGAASPPTATQ